MVSSVYCIISKFDMYIVTTDSYIVNVCVDENTRNFEFQISIIEI